MGGLGSPSCSGPCDPGHYCVAGSTSPTQRVCPPGLFGNTSGLRSPSCSGECEPGFWCPAGSTSPAQEACPDMLRRAAAANPSRRHGKDQKLIGPRPAVIRYLVHVVCTEPEIATEMLRLATSAVAQGTGLGGGHLSVGAEADFVMLGTISERPVPTQKQRARLDF